MSEEFQYDPNSGLYFIEQPSTDPNTGESVRLVTWYNPQSQEYSQVTYPIENIIEENIVEENIAEKERINYLQILVFSIIVIAIGIITGFGYLTYTGEFSLAYLKNEKSVSNVKIEEEIEEIEENEEEEENGISQEIEYEDSLKAELEEGDSSRQLEKNLMQELSEDDLALLTKMTASIWAQNQLSEGSYEFTYDPNYIHTNVGIVIGGMQTEYKENQCYYSGFAVKIWDENTQFATNVQYYSGILGADNSVTVSFQNIAMDPQFTTLSNLYDMGETISIHYNEEKTIYGVLLLNGNWTSREEYYDYGRVSALTLRADNGYEKGSYSDITQDGISEVRISL